jgi:thymidylate synthase
MSQTFTFPSADHNWIVAIQDLLDSDVQPSRNGPTREIVGWSSGLSDPRRCWVHSPQRNASLGYAFAELLWYLNGKRSIQMIKAYAPSYEKFADDGEAHGAYGDRWINNPGIKDKNTFKSTKLNGLKAIVELLKKNPDDRRAVLSCWDSGDLMDAISGEFKDIPCTVSLQFLIRNGKLHLHTYMRSNDVWLGTVYDVFCFCQIQMIVAAALGVKLGKYIHTVGSLHLYENNFSAAAKIEFAENEFQDAMPEPSQKEALALIEMNGAAPVLLAEVVMRNATRHTEIHKLGLDNWSEFALYHMQQHLMKKKGVKS